MGPIHFHLSYVKIEIQADPKYFFPLSVTYPVIVHDHRLCMSSGEHMFVLAQTTKYGLQTEAVPFLDKQSASIARVYQWLSRIFFSLSL